MVNPKKISEEGRALTCDEYDENLDILQNRANHVGTQSCTTISDLDVCLTTNPVIVALQDDIDSNEDRIQQIETDLSATGSFALDLQNVETALNVDIQQNRADIEAIETLLALEIRPDIDANTSNLATLTTTVFDHYNELQPRISALDDPTTGRMRLAENDINSLENSVNNITSNLIPAETLARQNEDQALSNRIEQVNGARISNFNTLTAEIDDERQDRIQDVNTVENKFDIITDALERDLDNEIDDRRDADTLLQAQINAVNASLASAIPTGTILAYAGTTAPAGFVFCRGQTLGRTSYSALFSVISTRYGNTSSSNFRVPDLRDRICFGSSNTNLNSVSAYVFQDNRTVPLPRHNHTYSISSHRHDLNFDHYHSLSVRGHSHPIGALPQHSHSLYPFRYVALGGGGEDNTGAEITTVPSDDFNDYPRTSNLEANSIPGPTVFAATERITPLNSGGNRTNNMEPGTANIKTQIAGPFSGSVFHSGQSSATIDVRQRAVRLNFIIKT